MALSPACASGVAPNVTSRRAPKVPEPVGAQDVDTPVSLGLEARPGKHHIPFHCLMQREPLGGLPQMCCSSTARRTPVRSGIVPAGPAGGHAGSREPIPRVRRCSHSQGTGGCYWRRQTLHQLRRGASIAPAPGGTLVPASLRARSLAASRTMASGPGAAMRSCARYRR
jgi:hypothetical protein